MILYISGHRYGYELQRITQLFFFGEKVTVVQGTPTPETQDAFVSAALCGEELLVSHGHDGQVLCRRSSAECFAGETVSEAARERVFGVLLYQMLSELTGISPPWGVLTGIRPVKLFLRCMDEGMDVPALQDCFMRDRLVQQSRFDLALRVARAEQPLLARSTGDSFSLYVSIPFCPTRCAYCSFVSHSVEQAARLIPDYVERLCEEISDTAQIANRLGLRLRTIYFGGGTPTSISAQQLSRIMEQVAASFDVASVWEYTVEAGRPDTITQEKLDVIYKWGARRISINPQTLSDEILRVIGRKHTVEQCLQWYRRAKEMGFSVNMDLIAGLPTDTREGFARSVSGLIAAAPQNITVHTLTVKRAARLSPDEARSELDTVRGMADDARQALMSAGYEPYYLYRQNGTLSALENVGFAQLGAECLYNVYMMDETHSVLAVGAGASTRLCHPLTNGIERIYNYKYPYEYLERFDEVKRRKMQIEAFLGTCNKIGDSV